MHSYHTFKASFIKHTRSSLGTMLTMYEVKFESRTMNLQHVSTREDVDFWKRPIAGAACRSKGYTAPW